MIVVTLGTIPYPFDRSVKWVKKLLDEGLVAETVFIQYGATDVSILQDYELVTTVSLLKADDLNQRIKQARLVISHAGQGSTRKLAAQAKSFVVLPRLAKYGEHIDDHQMRFSEGVESLGVKVCKDFNSLATAVINPPKPLNRDLFPGPKLGDFLAKKYNAVPSQQSADMPTRLMAGVD